MDRTRFSLGALRIDALTICWVVTALTAIVYFIGNLPVKSVLASAAPVVAGIVVIVATARDEGADRRGWALVGTGFVVFGGGNVFWWLLRYAYDFDSALISAANVLFVGGYLIAAAGLFLLIRRRLGGTFIRSVAVDAAIVLGGAGIALWILVHQPIAATQGISAVDGLLAVSYPFMDLVLLTIIGGLMVTTRARNISCWYLMTALGANLVADFGYQWLAAFGRYEVGAASDLGWFLAYGCLAAAVLHPSRTALTKGESARAVRMTRTRLAVFILAAAAGPIVLLVLQLVGRDAMVPETLPIAMLSIGGLVGVRVFGLVAQSDAYLARLNEAEARYRALVEQIPAVVYIDKVDDLSTCIYIGPQIEALLGYRADEWLATPGLWLTLIHPDDRARVMVEHARSIVDEDTFNCEFRMHGRDGSEVWVRDDSRVVESTDGKTRYWHGVLFDVTAERTAALEREALEGHLRQAHKMEAVGQLAGGMAHDFNNLLAVIQNYARFVYEELPESDPKRSDLEEVMKAGARGADLIRQLLTFAREEIVEPEILDINSVISDVSPLVRRVVPDNIEIRTNLQPGISTIEADRGQLDQMLINLAMNATDAMPEGGVLEIRSFDRRVDQISRRGTDELVPGQYVCLTVRDEGSGMSESVLARVFEPFFTTKGRASGPGLGLATVYGIVKRSGGYIDVESTPGEGSTFRIYFPTVGADVRGDAETHTSGQPNGATILVAEDEGAILKIVGRLLERAGYRVLLGETVLEALQLARSDEGIDLLLTDVVMPGQSGKQLSDTVSILRPGIPTLFMSGYPEDILARHDVRADVDNYIQKPFTSEALVAKIGSILGRAAAQPIEAGR